MFSTGNEYWNATDVDGSKLRSKVYVFKSFETVKCLIITISKFNPASPAPSLNAHECPLCHTMRVQIYKNYVRYLKTSSTCVVVLGGFWYLYQLRQISQIVRSTVNTNVLKLEEVHPQYIYINDPLFKDILMFGKDEDLYRSALEKPRGLGDILMKWWKVYSHNLAYKLLYMAQHGDKNERCKAVTVLGSLSYLKNWQYCHLAQMLDAKTAVALARIPDVNLQFFLQPPYYHIQYKLHDILEKIHSLLLLLDTLCNKTHPCLTQFLSKNFKDLHRDGFIFDHDLTSMGLLAAPVTIWDSTLLKCCVQSICHHSSLEEYSKHLVDAGALPILTAIEKICKDDIEMCILLARIISNVSLHTEYLEKIFESGWIGILSRWSRSDDIRLSAQAHRALANLDAEANEGAKYPRRIYLLHPSHRNHATTKMDVVFLHGLLGGVFVTWRQRDADTSALGVVDDTTPRQTADYLSTMIDDDRPQEFFKDLARDLQLREWKKIGHDFEVILEDCPQNTNSRANGPYFCKGNDSCMNNGPELASKTQCWPKDWLPMDVPSLRIIGINYDTSLSMWTPFCPIESMKSTIKERSEEYITKLIMANVGQRSLVWVSHSMGGLLVKKMLVEEWKAGDKNGICRNTRAIVFYSTPHRGSHVAALKQTTQILVWPTVEVQELREESPELLQLHEEFLEMLKEHHIEIVSFGETKSTLVTALKLSFQFVSLDSADPGVGEFFEIPQDHISICKPASRQSFLYQKLLSVLKRQFGNPQEEGKILSSIRFQLAKRQM
ncbi:PREDICTED: protein SERAC1-like isoform X2 [Dinoponera quadriceps]|uniref:Protein SERAC1 n=1 Tax=Dinoponera quadriceps TaxID=609295 RepID=A0A6P3X4L6_DINQU|nr:PREDICTED: protein SERAC1-like isoform X2 [Dinoponera quadriceps]